MKCRMKCKLATEVQKKKYLCDKVCSATFGCMHFCFLFLDFLPKVCGQSTTTNRENSVLMSWFSVKRMQWTSVYLLLPHFAQHVYSSKKRNINVNKILKALMLFETEHEYKEMQQIFIKKKQNNHHYYQSPRRVL